MLLLKNYIEGVDIVVLEEHSYAVAQELSCVPVKEGQKFQQAGNIEKAEENYKHATDVTSKKWKTDALYSLGVLFYNNGADVLRKATPLASSNKEKYASEKAKADAAFKKAVDYLGEAVTLSPNRTEIKQMQDQVKAMIK